jgi:hypothetical protein
MIAPIILATLVVLTLTHFIYEAILAPSFRASLRLSLFALRDRLRNLKMEKGAKLSDEVFRDLQGSINFAATRLNQIDLHLLKNAREAFERDKKLRERVARRIAMFEACPMVELHQIRSDYFEVLDTALAVNTGGWVPYLIPIVIGLVLRDSAQGLVKKVFSLTETEIDKIAPQDWVPAY